MNVENFTPFTPATFVSAKEGAGWVTTILVKAAFEMRQGKVIEPLAEPLYPLGDTCRDAGNPAGSSLAYASDFVPHKPRADILLCATAYRPASQPSGTFRAGFRVGNLVKQLAISGRREFSGLLSNSIVERDPLANISIVYENAFGGPKFPQNPVGKGHNHKSSELPSIEHDNPRLRMPAECQSPAGFGPLAADWEPRRSLFGTVGPDYLKNDWPGFPSDFDARYLNAAPADQQVDGFLRGDEEVVLENLHPQHAKFATQLPACRVVCLREDVDGSGTLIPLVLDTLWINSDENQLVLVWRGRISVQTPDALEIKRLGFFVEPLHSRLENAVHFQQRLQELIVTRDAEFELEPMPDERLLPKTVPDQTAEAGIDDLLVAEAVAAVMREKAGLPPDENRHVSTPHTLSPEGQAKFDEIMASVELEEQRQAEEDAAQRWTRDKVIAAISRKQSLVDADLSGIDLHDCNLSAADFRGAKLDEVDFSRSLLTRSKFTGCSMVRAVFDSAMLSEANLSEARVQGSVFTQANLVAANLSASDLSHAVFDGADLSLAVAERTVLQNASLRGANLARANLSAAVLSGIRAPLADFGGALLTGAACDHADFTGANFKKADLSDSDFSGSKLNDADLGGVLAVDANLTEAQLKNASLRGAVCDGMWLSAAQADGADFQRASCVDMQFGGTSAKHANFTGCQLTSFRGGQNADLTGANFRQAEGMEPVFESCLLDGADFSESSFPGANFIHASASQAKFTAAELRGARFDYANCQDAIFAMANLFQAVFAGANLIRADLSDSNFYGVEFLDARISKIRAKNCNLQMTKLQS